MKILMLTTTAGLKAVVNVDTITLFHEWQDYTQGEAPIITRIRCGGDFIDVKQSVEKIMDLITKANE